MIFDFCVSKKTKSKKNREHLSSVVFGFIVAFLYLNQSVDLIYDEPFGSFTLSHLIFNLLTKLNLNTLPSTCLSKSTYLVLVDLIISSKNTLESDSSVIIP